MGDSVPGISWPASTNDLNAVRMMLGPGVMYWTETSITLVLSIVVMLQTNVSLTLISLSPAPIVSLAVILFGRHIHTRFEHIQSMFSDISSRVQENLAGMRIVRAYAQEDSEVAEFERLNLRLRAREHRIGATAGFLYAGAAGLDRSHVPAGAMGRRHQAAAARAHPRQLCHVQHLHGHVDLAHDRARVGGQPDAAGQRFARAHQSTDAPGTVGKSAAESSSGIAGGGRASLSAM